jgi:hypothetical protein
VRRTAVVVLLPAVLALLTLPGCDRDEPASPGERREEAASALEGVPLQQDEVSEGLEPSEEGTGPIESLRDVLPPRSALPNLPPFPVPLGDAFRGGFETIYLRGQEGGGGPASAASSAIRFSEDDAASSFVSYLREVQVGAGRGPERTEVPVSGLGDEAFGWHREEPLGEASTVVWRTGDLVLTVSVGGSIGAATPEDALGLARTVHGRVAS